MTEVKFKQWNGVAKRRVYAKGWPERHGTVVQMGVEVSEIRWDDGSTMARYVPNDKLVSINRPKQRTRL